MLSICPKCKNRLTVKEAIQDRCNKCHSGDHLPQKFRTIDQTSTNGSKIKRNFEALISEELRKQMPRNAA